MSDKNGMLIFGVPSNVIRIFIETIHNDFDIFYISDRQTHQYQNIKKFNEKNTFLFDGTTNKLSKTRHLPFLLLLDAMEA